MSEVDGRFRVFADPDLTTPHHLASFFLHPSSPTTNTFTKTDTNFIIINFSSDTHTFATVVAVAGRTERHVWLKRGGNGRE